MVTSIFAMFAADMDFFDFFPRVKKRKLTKTSSQKCIICEEDRNEILRKGRAVATLVSAVKRHKDNVFRRLAGELEDLDKEDVYWHSSCYSSYTGNQNIRYAISNTDPSIVEHVSCEGNQQEREETLARVSRSTTTAIDWSRCRFCRNKTHRKVATMYNVSTFEACESIKNAADAKGDESMLHCLLSVNDDLIAAEAKYHKDCFSSYVSKSNLKHQGFGDNISAHDAAFKDLVRSITPGISDRRAYNMLTLLQNYQENLEERGLDGESYTKH